MDNNDKIALFDMDGTLADFVQGMQAGMKPLESPDERWDYDNYDQDNETAFMKARRRSVKNTPGFWRELPPYAPGFQLLRMAVDIGFRIMVFTKVPMSQPSAASEKIEWCHEHLTPFLGRDGYEMALVSNKGFTYGRILVDDWPPYIDAWRKYRPRGKVIMPAHKYNQGRYEGDPNVIRFNLAPVDLLKPTWDENSSKSMENAKQAMREAFER